jgi:outer membrane receptor protein involved in Fe transport
MGAVVQVFTRGAGPADRARVSGSIAGGSFDTWRGETHVGGGAFGRLDYHAGATHRRTGGAFSGTLREADRFEQTTADGSLGVALGPRASVRTGLRHSNALGRSVGQTASGPGNSGGLYATRELSWHGQVAHSAGRQFSGVATAALYRFDSESADRFADPSYTLYAILEGTPGARFPDGPRVVRYLEASEFAALSSSGGSLGPRQFLVFTPFGVSNFAFATRTVFRRPAIRYEGEYAWAGGQRLSAGYEYERESTPLDDRVTLHNNAFFVQQQFSVADRWFVTIGGRVDEKSSYDTFFSPKLSAGGFLRPYTPGAVSSVKVFGNIGTGIKTPSFLERFGASFADPNPGLVVERARTADAGVEMTFADGRARGVVTWFDNDVRDQVEYVPSSFSLDGIPDYVNIAGATARGVEIEAALLRPVAGVTVSGSYSFVGSEVRDTAQSGSQFLSGQPLIRRPRHSGALRARYGAGRLGVHGDVRFVGARHDAFFFFDALAVVPHNGFPAASSTDITVNPGYAVVGVGADLRARDGVTLFLRADNLTDTRYDSALGYPGLPRAFVAGVRFAVR